MPRPAVLHAPALEEVAYLVEATAGPASAPRRTAQLMDVLADLAARDRAGRQGLRA